MCTLLVSNHGGVLRVTPERAIELVEGARRGDSAAWEQLVDGYLGVIWATVRRYRLSEADATDVTQTTWLRLVQNIDRLEDPTRLGGWLATTASREALRVLAQRKRVVPTGDAATLESVDAHPIGVDSGVIDDERDTAMRELFEELPDHCRELLTMLLSDPPIGYKEISDALDMPVGSIGPTRGRCLKRLSALAEARGIDLAILRT
jgi:RNA polymerase sigma factor (sigma-70 family)